MAKTAYARDVKTASKLRRERRSVLVMKLSSSAPQPGDTAGPAAAGRNRQGVPAKNRTFKLRELSHNLSNALETILQASYLLEQADLPAASRRWLEMVESAAQDAAHLNRELRDLLRADTPNLSKKTHQPSSLELIPKPSLADAGQASSLSPRKKRHANKRTNR
jgi:signal transduction histidine kinase